MLGTHKNQKYLLQYSSDQPATDSSLSSLQPPLGHQPSCPLCSETTSNPTSETVQTALTFETIQTGLTSEPIQTGLTSETVETGLTSEIQSDDPPSSSPEDLNPLG